MNRIAISRMTATLIVIIIVIAIGAAVYFTLPPSTTTSLSTTTTTTKKPIKIGVIFDIGGRGDLSFNDMAWLGAERAKRDFNVSITYLQSRSQADYVPNLRQLASSGDYALIICIGFLMTDALNQTASEFPNQKFAIIDSIVNKPNVRSILFKENEGSALIGFILVL
jgi:basic membrane protein A